MQHRAPAKGEHPWCGREWRLLGRLAEPEDLVDRILVGVGRVVEHLGHSNGFDDSRDPGKHQRQNIVGESGVDPGSEERHSTGDCGRAQRLGEDRVDAVREDQRHHRARHHVLTGPQERRHVRDRLRRPQVGRRGIDHHVGVAGQDSLRLLVALTPTGPMPHNSPASRPALASLCTTTSTSCSCGWSITPRRAISPIEPGPHTPTLYIVLLILGRHISISDGW